MIIFLLIFEYFAHVTTAIYNPFTLQEDGTLYSSKYSDNRIRVISLNSMEMSNISVSVGGRMMSSFNFAEKDDNIRVKIYTDTYNPSLYDSFVNVRIKFFCEFSYPISVMVTGDSYQCSLLYKDKLGQSHSIGKCSLILQHMSTFCFIFGIVNTEHLPTKDHVKIYATVYRCNSQCARLFNLSWQNVVNTHIVLPLISWNHILWMKAFYKESFNVGILIGIPKSPINKSKKFEIPIKLKRSELNSQIKSITLQIIHNDQLSIEDIIPLGCFNVLDPVSYEGNDKNIRLTEIEINKNENDQCLTVDPDIFGLLLISAKEDTYYMEMRLKIENISFINNKKKYNGLNDKKFVQYPIKVPLFHGRHSIVPVIINPIILPNLESQYNTYIFKRSDIAIFYIFDENKWLDVTENVKCRPFNSSKLKCPKNMITLSPILTFVEDPESTKWSLELLIDDTLVIVTVEPLIIPDDNWSIMFPDSVLNMISGWRGPKQSAKSSLITETNCQPIFQVSLIQMYKKIIFFNVDSNKTMNMLVDMSTTVKINNIKISKNIAHIYKSGKDFLIQGLNYGDFQMELVTNDNINLAKTDMAVFNEPVSVTDLEVLCISDFKILNEVIFSSSSITIADIILIYKTISNHGTCLFIVDVIFSDRSKTNIIHFPKDQYSLRFISNTNIIEFSDSEPMWYSSDKFNNKQSFYVELRESKFCDNPKAILKKFVTLNIVTLNSYSTFSNPTIISISTNSSITSSSPSTNNQESNLMLKAKVMITKYLKWIIFILVVVVIFVLIIILVNIIIKYRKNKNLSISHFRRRKSLNGIELSNRLPIEKDYPPLLPPPGTQVQLSDNDAVIISSPHSFWCNEPNKDKQSTRSHPFVRQTSLPIKRCPSRGYNEIAPCPPLRWTNKIIHDSSTTNLYNSQEELNTDLSQDLPSFSPMTWSVTHMDVDESSGVGSLNTNMDDIIKDPYGSRERFQKLSELSCLNSKKKECNYDII